MQTAISHHIACRTAAASSARPGRERERAEVRWRWLKKLKRRSQRAFLPWDEFTSMTNRFFPPIRILHPQPLHRFDARTRGRSPVR